jgi:hypothetical protein
MGKQKGLEALGERTIRVDGKQYALYNPCRFGPKLAVQTSEGTG